MTSTLADLPTAPPLGYRPTEGVYDEMVAPDGTIRPAWRSFARFLAQAQPGELSGRMGTVQRLLRDNGVTFNIHDDALGSSRPWSLDLLPLIIGAAEWRVVAQGLAQRARLLDAILLDLYGAQRLLREGHLPPALLYANPSYLRAAVGITPPGGSFLSLIGTDLVRGGDGRWCAMADRLQTTSGQGYALENRIILSQVVTDEFNASKVERLAGFFDLEREHLRNLSLSRRTTSNAALLTPGPNHEAYFEHAFKARHLGLPLVESADLTVRDRRVYLKTLEGLLRVDVLLRRIEDHDSDPLEMGTKVSFGIPGLMEAWRHGGVAIVNGPGCGLVETPSLHPFLADLCRLLLGEELLLPTITTLWCGRGEDLGRVLNSPEKWVLKPAHGPGKHDPVFLDELARPQRDALLARVQASPESWIAQEILPLSTAPTLADGRLEPRPVVWRAFAVGSKGSFSVMPGGLSRVSPSGQRRIVTLRNGLSKDTWVLSDGESHTYGLPRHLPHVIRPERSPGAVPSRAADHLFWLGRYAERLEQTVRTIRSIVIRMAGEGSEESSRELDGAISLLRELGLLDDDKPNTALKAELGELLTDPRRPGSVPRLLSFLRFNAAGARVRLSDDTWRLFNRLERDAKPGPAGFSAASSLDMLDTLVLDLSAFSGMQQENMTHGHGWRFLELGRRIERGLSVLGHIAAAAERSSLDTSVLVPLLEICDSTMTYRRLHYSQPVLAPVLDLLVHDRRNPRSVARQIELITHHLALLPREPGEPPETAESGHFMGFVPSLEEIDLPVLVATPGRLEKFIPETSRRFGRRLENLSDELTRRYFSHAARRGR